jgi:hypothetical protein
MFDFRGAFGVCVAIGMLAGCVGSQGQTGTIPLGAASNVRTASTSGNCPALAGGTGILPDGDFSQGENAGTSSPTWYKGQVFAPDWEVSKGNIDFAGSTPYEAGLDGLCSVDLDGYYTVGGIKSSAFHTKRGATYTLSFLLSGNGHCSPTIKRMKVEIDHQFSAYSWNISSGYDIQDGDYATETWQFRAERLSTLTFVSQDPKGSSCGAVVGGIAITKD